MQKEWIFSHCHNFVIHNSSCVTYYVSNQLCVRSKFNFVTPSYNIVLCVKSFGEGAIEIQNKHTAESWIDPAQKNVYFLSSCCCFSASNTDDENH